MELLHITQDGMLDDRELHIVDRLSWLWHGNHFYEIMDRGAASCTVLPRTINGIISIGGTVRSKP